MQTEQPDPAWDSLLLPVTRLIYKSLPAADYGAFKYKLQRILYTKPPHHQLFYYSADCIQKVAPTPSGLKAISLFNKLYLPQCNSLCLQFQIDDALYSPSPQGLLCPIWPGNRDIDLATCTLCEWNMPLDAEFHISVLSMVHSLVETNNGFYHVGISLVPACAVFVPVWMSDNNMKRWLHKWNGDKMAVALLNSLVTISYKGGNTRVQSLAETRVAAYMSKWLYNNTSKNV